MNIFTKPPTSESPRFTDEEIREALALQKTSATGDQLLIPMSSTIAMRDALLQVHSDSCRALVASSTLRQVYNLSVAEGEASERTPWAAARYKAIVDAYAKKCMDNILKE